MAAARLPWRTRFMKFISYYRPYRRIFLIDMACSLVYSAIALLLPLCARTITLHVLHEDSPDALPKVLGMAGVMLGLLAAETVCGLFVDYQGHVMGARIESDMRRDLFNHYQKLPFGFYDENWTGQLMSRLSNDLFSVSELCHHGPEDLAIALLRSTGAFVILISLNVPLTLVVFAFFPLMTVFGLHFNRKMNRALEESRARIGDVNAQVEDTLAGIRVVKSFANEDLEQAKFDRQNARFVASRRDGYRSEAHFSGGMGAFTQLFSIAVIVFGGIGMIQGALDLPDLLTFLLIVGSLAEPIQRIVNFARLYQEGFTGFDRFQEMMLIEPEPQDSPCAADLTRVTGHLQFQAVSFRYREDHQYVVRDLSLDIQPGEFVAVVGSSGVGKTTLCALIPRFYEVTDGAILLDGQDIREFRLRALRRSIGVVQQDVYLFAGTVADNIRYGRPDASPDDIVRAARLANADEFIRALPYGYDTDIGQRGVKLSGGQKQRLSIARVFLKDPPILILDEATSALDNESERAIQESLRRLSANRTTLVIAHRLSTVRHAHRIVVLTDNGIGEQGTHDELIARQGAYASLYHTQLSL